MKKDEAPVDPAIRAWLDKVIIPILVENYLRSGAGKEFVSESSFDLGFATNTDQSSERDP
jgi:hypothetical protein